MPRFNRTPRKVPPGLIDEWKSQQAALRARLVVTPLAEVPRFVAGADAAFDDAGNRVFAVAVVYDTQEKRIVEITNAVRPIEFPYVPTFLSFREGPAVMEAIGKLKQSFGVVCFDGQGYAHPRRCGLATHVGVTLDIPTIGCAKSRLIGTHETPGENGGSSSLLMDKGETIGMVLRTRDRVNPIYLSVGHRVDLPSAQAIAMACVTRYRIPEPTRQADLEVEKLKRTFLTGDAGA